MKITRIDAIPFSIPYTHDLDLGLARRTTVAARHVLVRVVTDEGLSGVAEAPARAQVYGETQCSIVAMIDEHLAPAILGKDPLDLEQIHACLDDFPANNVAKGALDIALHDIIGKKAGLSLQQLLGGGGKHRVPVSWMVGLKAADEMARECARFAAIGFKAFKIKAGADPVKDVENFKAIRDAVGSEATLYIDANQGYGIREARWAIERMQKYGLAWVEEPCPIRDRRGRVELARSIAVPILGDESCFSPQDVARELELGALGMVSIKVARTGIFKSRKIVHLCEQAGVACLVGSQGESSLGAAAGAHFAAAFRNVRFPAEIGFHHQRIAVDLVRNPPDVSAGSIEVPCGAGLGVDLDDERLAEYRQR